MTPIRNNERYDDDDDRDDPLESDLDEDDDFLNDDYELPEMVCPNCRGRVTEDTQKCPRCGDWITPVDAKHHSPKRWLYVAIVLVIVGLLLFTTFR